MEEAIRKQLLSMSWEAHALTEASYQQDRSKPGDPGWIDKQRILLADMALHLLQTALKEGQLSEEGLRRNLFSILVLSDPFVRDFDLKTFAEELYSS